MKKRILFIGEFPPPYGGVTIKDSLIVDELSDSFDVQRFDLYRFKKEEYKFPIIAIQLIMAIKKAENICIGVGHPFRTCMIFRIARFLHGKKFQENITDFMMGIKTPTYLKKHPQFIPDISNGRCIFTESDQLIKQFEELGCHNARYLPNFRKGDKAREPRPVGEVVKFVYFAEIRPEKGIETLIDAVIKLNSEDLQQQFDVSVYGNIIDGYQNTFQSAIADIPNIRYKGAFDSSTKDVYAELNRYDSSVSSSWREGMSGSNIECKFAGIANIVSDAGYNPECVTDGVDGLLVKPRDVDSLAAAMKKVIKDHEFLYDLKVGSFASREKYDVANWKQEVVRIISE